MALENLLARLTPQSNGTEPRMPGGKPELTVADISLIASHAPPMAYHALMTKCCFDPISTERLYAWLQDTSLTEWFLNPVNEQARIQVGQANRLVSLSMIGWAIPNAEESRTQANCATYLKTSQDTFKRVYQKHFLFLQGELGYQEALGRRAIKEFIKKC